MPLTVARIDKATGRVINIECADQEWIDAHAEDPDFSFVAYDEAQPASIGGKHDPVTGFEPPAPPDTIIVTEKQLIDFGLSAKQVASLSDPAAAAVR